MRERFLIFGSPAIDEVEIAEVVATLPSGWIGTVRACLVSNRCLESSSATSAQSR